MKTKIKNKWIEALLSGKYNQGQGNLRLRDSGEDKFCCLGVFCDIVEPEGWGEGLQYDDIGGTVIYHTRRHCYPDRQFDGKYGLDDHTVADTARMNDAGKSFVEIAEWIRENVSEEE